jgi:hypothetical protein
MGARMKRAPASPQGAGGRPAWMTWGRAFKHVRWGGNSSCAATRPGDARGSRTMGEGCARRPFWSVLRRLEQPVRTGAARTSMRWRAADSMSRRSLARGNRKRPPNRRLTNKRRPSVVSRGRRSTSTRCTAARASSPHAAQALARATGGYVVAARDRWGREVTHSGSWDELERMIEDVERYAEAVTSISK